MSRAVELIRYAEVVEQTRKDARVSELPIEELDRKLTADTNGSSLAERMVAFESEIRKQQA